MYDLKLRFVRNIFKADKEENVVPSVASTCKLSWMCVSSETKISQYRIYIENTNRKLYLV
jgi:hypothetical protein